MGKKYDFEGWATKAGLKCSDGRTIMKDAFKDNDGETVPLVWNHQHNSPENILGHALLKNTNEGVYAYGKFNDSDSAKAAKALVDNGDITSMSILANDLVEKMSCVLHGTIREVSLVLAPANPGAKIQSVIKHGVEVDDEAIIYTGEDITLNWYDNDQDVSLQHADEEKKDSSQKNKEEASDNEETIQDVFNTLSEKQKNVVYAIVGQILEDEDGSEEDEEDEEDEGETEMKHNVFDQNVSNEKTIISHSDQEAILDLAKKSQVGSFKTAMEIFADENNLQHDALSSGFIQTGGGNVTNLFPEYKEVRPGEPELITSDQGWISVVMNKVHKSPISRIRTSQVDIRKIDSLRGRGYQKGKQKTQAGNFKLVRRTTDPQTVYVKNALHRDDIIDITDFDYVNYLYKIDRMMLNEELATAIMLGDGREEGDADKIDPSKIRPIWLDDDLYTLHVDVDIEGAKSELQGSGTGANFGENYIYAEALINSLLYARENYKGSGTPDLFCTPHLLNVMSLARDMNGRRIYSSVSEIASALNVGAIYTAEQFEGKTRTTSDSKKKKLLALVVNLNDYSLGATKGGEVTHFTQFDIDFNQEKSLLETRCSGALTRVYSAIALEEDVTSKSF